MSLHLLMRDRNQDRDQVLPEHTSAKVMAEVDHVLAFIKGWTNEEQRPLREHLQRIFCQAIELSRMLRQQRASWVLEYPEEDEPGGLKLNDRDFEVAGGEGAGEERPDVMLVIQPIVYKCGNGYGAMYDEVSVMLRAKVLLR